jgi:DNA invertase Pin-like site-specific DNA recombinase
MRAIIYTRISTNDEKQNIKQQRDYCRKFAEKEGYEVLHVMGDKISGKVPISERSGGKRMLKFLEENPKVHLIVQDIDRISRDFYDAVEFEKFIVDKNITVKSLSEMIDLKNPMGKLMFRIKISMNAFYIENLIQKILVGVARAKKEGKYKGRQKGALGKKTLKKLIQMENEQ